MKVTQLNLPVMASWMESNGRRLDCNPYLSGGFEARVLLDKLDAPKQPMHEVTERIIHAGREGRTYVNDPKHGVPFLGSTDILAADLSWLPLLSKKQIDKKPQFTIQEGWTLITRSGTIGRMAYTRPDMAGMACSEHVLRVVPDRTKILPGYLYAYLSSRFGVALIVSGTYGSIIQHLEPSHIADLPVPRLGDALEQRIHNLITEAAELRTKASYEIRESIQMCLNAWGLSGDFRISKPNSPDTFIVSANKLNNRLDGFFHSTPSQFSDSMLAQIGEKIPLCSLEELTQEIFETTRFGRVEVEESNGVAFLSISDLTRIDPKPDTYISKKQAETVRAKVSKGWTVLPRVGQLQGAFGNPAYIPSHLDQVAVSDNNIRIVPRSDVIDGYLFAALSTPIGYWQIIRQACGTSIPYTDANRLKQILLPLPQEEICQKISDKVNFAMDKRSNAVLVEKQAIDLIEGMVSNTN